jgi:hypothetical protein
MSESLVSPACVDAAIETPGRGTDTPLYHLTLRFAMFLVLSSLVALAIQNYRQPDADNQPAPFSCSIVPLSP